MKTLNNPPRGRPLGLGCWLVHALDRTTLLSEESVEKSREKHRDCNHFQADGLKAFMEDK
jgi:hypothetical protein